MSSIRLERVSFAYSDLVPLLADVEVHVGRGFTGVVGENGAGKSTLLRLVDGTLAPTSGHVVVEPRDALIAVCPQDVEAVPDGADIVDGRWLGLLALDDEQLARWPTLSPGERRRWQIAAALSRTPDVLLLDEPTNHLDATSRALLLGALGRFRGVALVISHDRVLLDELTSATLRVHGGTARLNPGGYSAAKAAWEADAAHARDVRGEAQRVARHEARRLADARRGRAEAEAAKSGAKRKKGPKDHDATSILATTKIAWAEARMGRQVELARRRVERAEAAVPDAPIAKELGRSVFVGYERAPRRWLFELAARELYPRDVHGVPVSDDERSRGEPVLRDVRVAVGNQDRIRIAGANGAGKSTLLAALLAHDRGTPSELPRERLLYLPQELAPDAGVQLLAEVRRLSPDVRGRTLSLVAALGVDPDRLLASASPSPGEARKLALAMGLGRHAWCVVLDEPTNHLDLPSIERVEAALVAYPGALVLVTHDDHLASACTTSTWHVADGRVT